MAFLFNWQWFQLSYDSGMISGNEFLNTMGKYSKIFTTFRSLSLIFPEIYLF